MAKSVTRFRSKPLGDQMNTRLFHLDVPYDREQIAEVLITQGNIEVRGVDGVDTSLVAFQAYLQTKAPWDVVVPLAPSLAIEIPSQLSHRVFCETSSGYSRWSSQLQFLDTHTATQIPKGV